MKKEGARARESLEADLEMLKSRAGPPNMVMANLKPVWTPEENPDADWTEYAPLGDDRTLWVAKPTDEVFRQAPKGAFRISWSVWSKAADKPIVGGGATSREEAKEYAYRAYQASYGYIRGDA